MVNIVVLNIATTVLQERAYVTNVRPPGPLPEESSFVAAARELIPQRTRQTTATAAGRRADRAKRKATTTAQTNAGTVTESCMSLKFALSETYSN